MAEKQVKTKRRVADYGEVYTAPREVNAMLDMVKQETERVESRFLEPACGNGNFLIEVLTRKLAKIAARYGKSRLEYERYAVSAPPSRASTESTYWKTTSMSAGAAFITISPSVT
jgi:hypothetical protein